MWSPVNVPLNTAHIPVSLQSINCECRLSRESTVHLTFGKLNTNEWSQRHETCPSPHDR
jgi:hypothetical protein